MLSPRRPACFETPCSARLLSMTKNGAPLTYVILRKPRSGCLEGRTAIALAPAAPYIFRVGQPTMAINGLRNKRCGPGGGTRRLHQFPPVWRIDCGRRLMGAK